MGWKGWRRARRRQSRRRWHRLARCARARTAAGRTKLMPKRLRRLGRHSRRQQAQQAQQRPQSRCCCRRRPRRRHGSRASSPWCRPPSCCCRLCAAPVQPLLPQLLPPRLRTAAAPCSTSLARLASGPGRSRRCRRRSCSRACSLLCWWAQPEVRRGRALYAVAKRAGSCGGEGGDVAKPGGAHAPGPGLPAASLQVHVPTCLQAWPGWPPLLQPAGVDLSAIPHFVCPLTGRPFVDPGGFDRSRVWGRRN